MMSSTKRSAVSTTGCSNEKGDSEQPPTKATKLHNENDVDYFITRSATTSSRDQLAKIELMVSWIKDLGAVLPSIEIKPCPKGGGFGAFATTDIPPGGLVGRIPNEAIMTVEKSSKSIVGIAVASTNFENENNKNNDTTKNPCKNDDDGGDNTKEEIPCRPTPEFVFWLDMCHGRQDSNHPHHPYLVSLPSEPPDLPSWPSEARKKLEGTNLGIAASKVSNELKQQYDKWVPTLQRSHPKLFTEPGFEYKDIIWASGMYYSRRFPTVLLLDEEIEDKQLPQQPQICKLEPEERNTANTPANTSNSLNEVANNSNKSIEDCDAEKYHILSNPSNKSVGIMLPFLDMLNHRHHQQITWCREKTAHVSFRTGPKSNCDLTQAYTESYTGPAAKQGGGGEASTNANTGGSIPAGSEIYNNYGPKGNEMLMMMYGFALPDNIHDSYGLHLVLMTAATTQPNNNNNDGTNTTNAASTTTSTMNILEKKDLGTYQIHRRDSPIDHQFPPGLWKALNQMFIEEELEEEDQHHNQQNDSGGSKPADVAAVPETITDIKDNGDKGQAAATATATEEEEEEEGEEVQPIEVSPEAVEFLLETLQRRIQPFVSTKEEDSSCETDIAKYRNGQRIVLEEAIETLTQMLPEEEEEEIMNA